MALGRIVRPKKQEVTGQMEILHNEEVQNYIIRTITSSLRITRTEHVASK